MAVALQIRNVPEQVRDALAQEALRHGRSLQAHLLGVLEREAQLLRHADVFERTRDLRVELSPTDDVVALVREGRDGGFEIDRDRG